MNSVMAASVWSFQNVHIYFFYINEPGKEVYDNNNNNNDNDDNNDDDVNSNSLFSCCHSDWAGLFSSLQISQTCCLNTAIVLIQLLSVCLLLSPFFPSSLAVWAVMLFSTCQNTKLSLRSAFFILWLRHRRSEELCDRRDADKLVHCFEGPFFSVLTGAWKETLWRGNEASKQWFHAVCNFLILN